MSRRPHTRWLRRLLLLTGLLMLVVLPTAAMADYPGGNYPPGTTVTTNECISGDYYSQVCGTVVSQDGGSLPFTGGNIALLTVIGLVAAAAGCGLVWLGRRSSASA